MASPVLRPAKSATYAGDGAHFSRDKHYRYHLWRTWDAGNPKRVVFIGLNPSTANASHNDATVRRCVAFASGWTGRWRVGGFSLVNLYAFCTHDPAQLCKTTNPQGSANGAWLRKICFQQQASFLLAMWGNHGSLHDRSERFLRQCQTRQKAVHCLRINAGGQPAHPLYLPANLSPIRFQ